MNHEPGNIYVYAPQQKVLMPVDVIFPGWVPFKNLALAEDTAGYLEAHDQVLSFDFDTFVGGHWNRLGTREDVEIQQGYMADLQTYGARALQAVDFLAVAPRRPALRISLFFLIDSWIGSHKCALIERLQGGSIGWVGQTFGRSISVTR